MNTVDRAMKYQNIQWTKEQEEFFQLIFTVMEHLLIDCEREQNQEKIDAIKSTHQTIHDIILSIYLNEKYIKEVINETIN